MQSQTHYSPKKVQRVHSSELKYLATNFLILRIWGYAMKVVFIVIGFIFIIFFGGVSKSMLTLNEAIIDVKKG